MLQINGKTFMNLQEAVQWLLDNNALPFQSSANYVANTEIGLGTIVNPSPAKVRIGSLIFFADSKVSTVIGITENGFIVSDQYNDLVDDVVYVSNVALNASGHLIVTLSNGTNIDAGLIKQVSGFSIDGSQHLIVTYNDGTTSDLGAIFSGSITVSGDLTVTGTIDGGKVTGNEIIEKMVGYSFSKVADTPTEVTSDLIYASVVKTGNKITFVIFGKITKVTSASASYSNRFRFYLPDDVMAKLFPYTFGGDSNILDVFKSLFYNTTRSHNVSCACQKNSNYIDFSIWEINDLEQNDEFLFRIEKTFLLSNNLLP